MGIPDRFTFHVEYQLDAVVDDGTGWILATDGGLEAPVAVRVGRDPTDRAMISGLLIGVEEPVPITSDTLRKIRLSALISQLFEGFDPAHPPNIESDFHNAIVWGLMHEHVWSAADRVDPAAGRGPSGRELEAFANAYRRELVRDSRRAVAATAAALNVSVATAHRRITACRAQGLLPPRT